MYELLSLDNLTMSPYSRCHC